MAAFVGDKKSLALKFVARGSGVDGLLTNLIEDTVQYALIRTTQVVDGYDTTKFNLVKYEGTELPIAIKGTTFFSLS